jgi:hypothetical protein
LTRNDQFPVVVAITPPITHRVGSIEELRGATEMKRRSSCVWSHAVSYLCAGLLTTLIVGSTVARASIITTNFSGVLTAQFGAIPSRFNGIFAVGNAFTGRYVYDSNLPAVLFVPQGTMFYDGSTEFLVTVNGFTSTASIAAGEVSNNQGAVDAFGVRTGKTAGPFNIATGPVLAGAMLREIQLQFRDETATALSSSALPASIIDLADFPKAFITFTFRDTTTNVVLPIWGVIQSVSGTMSVPEPSVLTLLANALAGLAFKRRTS